MIHLHSIKVQTFLWFILLTFYISISLTDIKTNCSTAKALLYILFFCILHLPKKSTYKTLLSSLHTIPLFNIWKCVVKNLELNGITFVCWAQLKKKKKTTKNKHKLNKQQKKEMEGRFSKHSIAASEMVKKEHKKHKKGVANLF